MLKIEDVSMDFYETNSIVQVLKNINLEICSNELTIIKGPSGSGKTTLLNIIGGLLLPTSGKVLIDNQNIVEMSDDEKADFRNQKLGYVFQAFYLEPNFTVFENVEIPLVISGMNKNERKNKINLALSKVGLLDKQDVIVSKLSGGEKQRVCIARAIVNDPKIIIADEPTGNLDSKNGELVMDMLKSLCNEDRIVIVITHNNDHATKYGDKIYELNDGVINEKK